jgi:hypothetical protein
LSEDRHLGPVELGRALIEPPMTSAGPAWASSDRSGWTSRAALLTAMVTIRGREALKRRPDFGDTIPMSQRRLTSLDGGDPGWIRTIDLPLRRRPLYPLSYEATASP